MRHASLQGDPHAQLSAWVRERTEHRGEASVGDKLSSFLYVTTLILVVAASILGVLSGAVLLHYNGEKPVNLVYFLAVGVWLPLITTGLSIIAMFRANSARNTLVHISPAFWMERLFVSVSPEKRALWEEIEINPRLLNWIVVKRAQLIALAFSAGLLISLLWTVATEDIAFAWSTTLDISPERFHALLHALAFPWREWLPSAVPSLELVTQSHYFRLGGTLRSEMVAHASMLGLWWKFLAVSVLFYAVMPRILLYFISKKAVGRAFKGALLAVNGVETLLRDMNEPLVRTHTEEKEIPLRTEKHDEGVRHGKIELHYDSVQGWAIDEERLMILCDRFGIVAKTCREAGGNNTLEADRRLAEESEGKVLLFVKAWEPPTMDFIDYAEMLLENVSQMNIFPVGTPKSDYQASQRDRQVWERKLAVIENDKVIVI